MKKVGEPGKMSLCIRNEKRKRFITVFNVRLLTNEEELIGGPPLSPKTRKALEVIVAIFIGESNSIERDRRDRHVREIHVR